jgi:hypothetical protein
MGKNGTSFRQIIIRLIHIKLNTVKTRTPESESTNKPQLTGNNGEKQLSEAEVGEPIGRWVDGRTQKERQTGRWVGR